MIRPCLNPCRCATYFLSAILIVSGLPGCGPSAVKMTNFSPAEVATNAIQAYDTDKDGAISGDELDLVPAIQAAIGEMDQDGDKKITAAEIEAGLANWNTAGVAITTVECRVTMNGQPLPGATVTFEPESFHGDALKAATGISDEVGLVTPSSPIASEYGIEGLQLGFYKVRVSKEENGVESIPDKYNTATTLGRAVSPNPRSDVADLQLKSR